MNAVSFRHEYGRLVAVLVRRVGLDRLQDVEDAVQSALVAALTSWSASGVPDQPSAWLFTVARNELYSRISKDARRRKILEQDASASQPQEAPHASFDREIDDELLRMLFVCSDDALPTSSQIAFALKTLCGFSTAEIAFRLFTTEANVYKRLARARVRLRETLDIAPSFDTLKSRISSVHNVIYLLFNEGYLSTHAEHAIRLELCTEAIRLGELLAAHPIGETPTSFALLALMHLHASRLAARNDPNGGLLLLEEQDRSRWDRAHIQRGSLFLARSAQGETFTRFHAEAGIAAEHCFAPSFETTRWDKIADLYAMLERMDPSPFHSVNRAIALAESNGPEAGLALLETVTPPSWLVGHYLWHAVWADLLHRVGDARSVQHRERALEAAPSDAVRAVLSRRLNA